jgi:hypothetical protein
LGVVTLFLGAMIETLDLSMAALSSFFCIFAVIELGGAYPWLIYAVTSVLSIILMPYSLGGWFYLLFFGFYPILKEKIEASKRPISWGIKLIVLNIALICGTFIAYFLIFGKLESKSFFDAFLFVFGGEKTGKWVAVGTYALFNGVFVLYDVALTRLITFYVFKLRKKFKIFK